MELRISDLSEPSKSVQVLSPFEGAEWLMVSASGTSTTETEGQIKYLTNA